MQELIIAVLVFITSHLLPMLPACRRVLEQRLGQRLFLWLYSLLSVALIVWLALAFKRAPLVLLWPWTYWAAWLPVWVMPLACILLVAGISSPNPFSLGWGIRAYDPARPGIVSITRHPVLWALLLWAGSHIPINGDAAALLLFGLLLLLSLIGTWSLERNRQRRLQLPQWAQWRAATANIPFTAASAIDWRGIGWWRVAGGLLLYTLLLFGHQPVIGVPPPLLY